MGLFGWTMFIIASLCGLGFYRLFWRSLTRERHLQDYIIYLLISDTIRDKHKRDFEKYIQQTDAINADQFHIGAHRVIENMAEVLAKGNPSDVTTSSMLGAHAMLWNLKNRQHIDSSLAYVPVSPPAICTACSHPLRQDAQFCTQCGAAIEHA